MVDRWADVGNELWAHGQNIPYLLRGGSQGGRSLNAGGMQFFGNCVRNVDRLPKDTLKEMYATLTGAFVGGLSSVDAVSFVAVIGGISNKNSSELVSAVEQEGLVVGVHT
jgi:hypothetical protein